MAGILIAGSITAVRASDRFSVTGAGAAGTAATAGPGATRAEEIVGAVSSQRTAVAEATAKKPEPKDEPSDSASATSPGPARSPGAATNVGTTQGAGGPTVAKTALPISLPSRLELTAGTDGLLTFSDVTKQVSLFAEARYRLSKMLQLGGSLALRYQGGDIASDVAIQALVGPTINFTNESGIQNAFFISPKVGVTSARTSFNGVVVNSNTQFTVALSVGKRFALVGDTVAYAPSVGVVKEMQFSTNFVIQPIAISIFF